MSTGRMLAGASSSSASSGGGGGSGVSDAGAAAIGQIVAVCGEARVRGCVTIKTLFLSLTIFLLYRSLHVYDQLSAIP